MLDGRNTSTATSIYSCLLISIGMSKNGPMYPHHWLIRTSKINGDDISAFVVRYKCAMIYPLLLCNAVVVRCMCFLWNNVKHLLWYVFGYWFWMSNHKGFASMQLNFSWFPMVAVQHYYIRFYWFSIVYFHLFSIAGVSFQCIIPVRNFQ